MWIGCRVTEHFVKECRDEGGGPAVGLGASWDAARARAYELAARARFEGAWFRPDIGAKMYHS